MRVRARIDDYTINALRHFMNFVDKGSFAITLETFDVDAESAGFLPNLIVQVGQRAAAVNLGFALAQQIQVRTMQDRNPHFFRLCSQDLNISRSSSSPPSPS